MPAYEIPGRGTIDLDLLVLDLNGTLTVDGQIVPGVAQRIQTLQEQGFDCYLLTADTCGTGSHVAETLGLHIHRLSPGQELQQKRAFVEDLGAAQVAAIGNGANDELMLAAVREAGGVAIAVDNGEGCHTGSLARSNLFIRGAAEALDLLLDPKRLIAGLRR